MSHLYIWYFGIKSIFVICDLNFCIKNILEICLAYMISCVVTKFHHRFSLWRTALQYITKCLRYFPFSLCDTCVSPSLLYICVFHLWQFIFRPLYSWRRIRGGISFYLPFHSLLIWTSALGQFFIYSSLYMCSCWNEINPFTLSLYALLLQWAMFSSTQISKKITTYLQPETCLDQHWNNQITILAEFQGKFEPAPLRRAKSSNSHSSTNMFWEVGLHLVYGSSIDTRLYTVVD